MKITVKKLTDLRKPAHNYPPPLRQADHRVYPQH